MALQPHLISWRAVVFHVSYFDEKPLIFSNEGKISLSFNRYFFVCICTSITDFSILVLNVRCCKKFFRTHLLQQWLRCLSILL